MLNGVCNTPEVAPLWKTAPPPTDIECRTVLQGEDCVDCIDLYQFNFLFPSSARKEDMWLCGREIWLVCESDLPDICNDWIFCVVASFLVVVGVSVHLVSTDVILYTEPPYNFQIVRRLSLVGFGPRWARTETVATSRRCTTSTSASARR